MHGLESRFKFGVQGSRFRVEGLGRRAPDAAVVLLQPAARDVTSVRGFADSSGAAAAAALTAAVAANNKSCCYCCTKWERGVPP